jgi:tetratricopeptide (TPR) repeat protein
MRIGQVLFEAGLITPKQLSDGLEFGTAKHIFLGKAMTLLHYVSAEDVERALQTQKLIKIGLSPVLAIQALKRSVKDRTSLEQALREEHLDSLYVPHNLGATRPIEFSSVELEFGNSPESLINNGDKLLIEDCCTEALYQYQQARLALEKSLGSEHIDLAPVWVRLGNTYLALRDFVQARECYERVLYIRRAFFPANHPQIALAFESLADLYNAQNEPSLAVEAFLAALDILERKLPAQLGTYAAILRKLTRSAQIPNPGKTRRLPVGEILKAAEIITDEQLKLALRMSKQSSLPIGIVLRENCMTSDRELQSALKAQFCISQGVLSEQLAVNLLARAARRDISLERLLHEAGVLMSDEEKFDLYRQIASELDHLVSTESSAVNPRQEVAPIAYKLGALYEQVGDQSQSEVYYSRALTVWGSASQGDLAVANACASLAKIYQGQNRHEEALPLLEKALEHRKQALGFSHEETIEILEALSEAELFMQNTDSALEFAQQALSYREDLGQDGTSLLRAVVLVGDCLVQIKLYDDAKEAYNRAMNLARAGGQQPTAALAAVMEKLGDLYGQQKMSRVATPLYKGASLILEAAERKNSQNYQRLQIKISELEPD